MIQLEKDTLKRSGEVRVVYGVYDSGMSDIGLMIAEDTLRQTLEGPQIGQGFVDYKKSGWFGVWKPVRSAYQQRAEAGVHPVLVELRAIDSVRPWNGKRYGR